MLLHHARNHESDNLALQSLKLAPLTPFSLNNLGFAMERKVKLPCTFLFFFSSRRRHTRSLCDWSSYVCSSDLAGGKGFFLVVDSQREEILTGLGRFRRHRGAQNRRFAVRREHRAIGLAGHLAGLEDDTASDRRSDVQGKSLAGRRPRLEKDTER